MKKVFLFDLDGTLCASRKKIGKDMIDALDGLADHGDIGILTGSDMDFLKEQCQELFSSLGSKKKVYALACNGTKAFEVKNSGDTFAKIKEESIKEFLGDVDFNDLMKEIIFMQADLITNTPIPLTGNFITCRGSTVNWCPIGRGATDEDRESFIKKDKALKIRERENQKLKSFISSNNLDLIANIAGDTSFDIYPNGWDKTYAMKFFENCDVYFWGDRMIPDGNDYTMHLLLKDKSFPIKDPEDTIKSIKKLVQSF